MAEFNIPKPGSICWRELATKDIDKATSFYSHLFGWTLEQSKLTPMAYSEIIFDGKAQGGIMPIDENWPQEAQSQWATYIAVANADETVQKITANGGTVTVPPFDAAGIGRMSLAADPSGARFVIIQFTTPE